MTQNEAKVYIRNWSNHQHFLNTPLLSVQPNGVTVVPHPGNHSRLSCSQELRTYLQQINKQVAVDRNGPGLIEGIIYTVHRSSKNGEICPLYVGIARCAGRDGNLSILFTHDMNRFHHGRGTNGHVDKITRTINGEINVYAHWTTALFNPGAVLNGPFPAVVLRAPVFVHIELWGPMAGSIIPDDGHRPIDDEEMLRISVFRTAGFAQQLLNRHGNAD